jgi:hypothetical protein
MESRLGNEGKEEKHNIFFSETGNKDGSLIHRGAAWKSLEGCRGAVHLTANGRSRLREGMTVMKPTVEIAWLAFSRRHGQPREPR